jgi:hypothetical protein
MTMDRELERGNQVGKSCSSLRLLISYATVLSQQPPFLFILVSTPEFLSNSLQSMQQC